MQISRAEKTHLEKNENANYPWLKRIWFNRPQVSANKQHVISIVSWKLNSTYSM